MVTFSDVAGRSESALHPERAYGFRSGSPDDLVIDRKGIVRANDVPRLALPALLDQLLAER